MKQSLANGIAFAILILQAILDAFNVFNFEPEFKQWALVLLTGTIVILNAALSSFKEINALVIVNVLVFILFFVGGIVDQVLHLVPGISTELKADIIMALGLVSNIVNLLLKRLKTDAQAS
jgi:uncharacterized membrane protein